MRAFISLSFLVLDGRSKMSSSTLVFLVFRFLALSGDCFSGETYLSTSSKMSPKFFASSLFSYETLDFLFLRVLFLLIFFSGLVLDYCWVLMVPPPKSGGPYREDSLLKVIFKVFSPPKPSCSRSCFSNSAPRPIISAISAPLKDILSRLRV